MWLEESGYNINDSSSYGNCLGEGGLKNTGATAKAKTNNIYDLAGNAYEWTQEAYEYTRRTLRGGGYASTGVSSPIISRGIGGDPTEGNISIGTRPTFILNP